MMNEEQIVDIITSYCDGKKIQYRNARIAADKWKDCEDKPVWNFHHLEYQVKPDANEGKESDDTRGMTNIQDMPYVSGKWPTSATEAAANPQIPWCCHCGLFHSRQDCPIQNGAEAIVKASELAKKLSSLKQSETFDWKTAAKLWAEGVDIQIRGTISWADFLRDECATFLRLGTYRRKPSPVTPDKKEEELPASETTEDHPSRAYLLGRIENLEDVVRKLISKSEYEKVRHE